MNFLKTAWPAIRSALDHLNSFDYDGDGIPENEGFPDQTYDIWIAKGASAYTGGLWLAALSAASSIADILSKEIQQKTETSECDEKVFHTEEDFNNDDSRLLQELQESKQKYQNLLKRGMSSYTKKLWNGKYFNYDASNSPYHDTIMADQLAGQWYARACGLPPISDEDKILKAFTTVFENNVMGFKNGTMGAMNGIRPSINGKDAQVDKSCIQSQEVWTGVTYAVSAAMLQESILLDLPKGLKESDVQAKELRDKAFRTSEGIYSAGWDKLGYFFQTPEAWDTHGHYRSLAYMRPLSIWSMQWALEVVPHIWQENESE